MPELRQLRAFLAVAEELNFTRAAERLSLGQQAVSKTVGQLERELGVELLERTTREVRLTAAGEQLLEAGRPALERVDAAFEAAAQVGRGAAGTVKVGASPAISLAEKQAVVEALTSGGEVVVSFFEVRPSEVARRLRSGELELVLARTGGTAPGIESAPLRPSPTALIVPEGHRLAGRRSVSLAELDGERLMVWNPPGTPFTDLMLDAVRAAGATVEPVPARVIGAATLNDLRALRAVALAPTGDRRAEGLAEIPLEEPLTMPLLLMWQAGRPSPAVARLREAMARPG